MTAGFAARRGAHPRATLTEIVAKVDRALAAFRTQTVVDLITDGDDLVPPRCPVCDRPMHRHDKPGRGPDRPPAPSQSVPLLWHRAFPLSERLGLVPGALAPWLAELASQFGTETSFARRHLC